MPTGYPNNPRKQTAKPRSTAAQKAEMKLSQDAVSALRAKLAERNYKDDLPDMPSREELVAKVERYGQEIESLEASLRTAYEVKDELRHKLLVSERRLGTVLDLVAGARA